MLMLMLMGDAMSTAVYQMLPAIAAERLGGGVGGMSTLLSAACLGATISAFWLTHGGARRVTVKFVFWALHRRRNRRHGKLARQFIVVRISMVSTISRAMTNRTRQIFPGGRTCRERRNLVP